MNNCKDCSGTGLVNGAIDIEDYNPIDCNKCLGAGQAMKQFNRGDAVRVWYMLM